MLAVFDHDVVAVGETAQFFAVASVNGGQIAVAVVVVAHQLLAVEGDGGEAVRRLRVRRFGRGRLKVGFQTTSISTNASIGNGIGLLKNGCFRDGLTGFVLGLDPTYLLWLA